jgi:DNA-binding response OmpR family regulator
MTEEERLRQLDRAGPPDDVRVLFVEDDTAIAQMYKLKLELDGYRVDVAGDSEVALHMARTAAGHHLS